MKYYEKLNYLMILTGFTNAKLARNINVDPSLFSKWRRGARNPNNNPDIVNAIAHQLASKVEHLAQKEDLQATSGIALDKMKTVGSLTEELFCWLWETEDGKATELETKQGHKTYSNGNEDIIYWGGQGRKKALKAFMQTVEKSPKCEVLRLFCDESSVGLAFLWLEMRERVKRDKDFLKNVKEVKIILPAYAPKEVLHIFWEICMLLMGGTKVCAVRQPHTVRDMFQHTLLLFGSNTELCTVGFYGSERNTTLLYQSKTSDRYIEADVKSFDSYYDEGLVVLKPIKGVAFWDVLHCLMERFEERKNIYYRAHLLPNIVLKPDIAEQVLGKCDFWKENSLTIYQQFSCKMEQFLKTNRLYVTFALLTPQQVEQGKAKTMYYAGGRCEAAAMTQQQYLQTLKYILKLHIQYANFVLLLEETDEAGLMCILQENSEIYLSLHPQESAGNYYSHIPGAVKAFEDILQERYVAPALERQTREKVNQKLQNYIDMYCEEEGAV